MFLILFSAEDDIAEVVNRYSAVIIRIACHYLKSNTDAEDATQTVFIRWLEKRPVFDTEEHRKAWFIRTTVNVCKNQLNSAWRRKTVHVDELPEPETGESGSVLEEVLALPEKFRAVVYLYYFEGYDLREIAGILKISEGTVRSRMYRARQKLKFELEDTGYEKGTI